MLVWSLMPTAGVNAAAHPRRGPRRRRMTCLSWPEHLVTLTVKALGPSTAAARRRARSPYWNRVDHGNLRSEAEFPRLADLERPLGRVQPPSDSRHCQVHPVAERVVGVRWLIDGQILDPPSAASSRNPPSTSLRFGSKVETVPGPQNSPVKGIDGPRSRPPMSIQSPVSGWIGRRWGRQKVKSTSTSPFALAVPGRGSPGVPGPPHRESIPEPIEAELPCPSS